ncbi:MAG: DotU family type IV/VI secretion system protein [Desulfovibrionaceae bacterium]
MNAIRDIFSTLYAYIPMSVARWVMFGFALLAVGGILGKFVWPKVKGRGLVSSRFGRGKEEPAPGPSPVPASMTLTLGAATAAEAPQPARRIDPATMRFGGSISLPNGSRSFLATQFLEFYTEVVRLKHFVVDTARSAPVDAEAFDAAATAPAEAPATDDEARDLLAPFQQTRPVADDSLEGADREPPQKAASIHARLLALLEQQALDARRSGGEYGASYYKDAQYVMAALADEILLNLDWEGRDAWRPLLLEHRLFGTKMAGERFFEKLDRLLLDRDPVYTDMAMVYFLALALGFSGKYRETEDMGKLAFYRRELFAFIYHRKPDLNAVDKRLFPDAYAHTMEKAEAKKLPHVRVWAMILAGVCLAYLAMSQVMWANMTADLDAILGQILR